jgi:hypothetical protein
MRRRKGILLIVLIFAASILLRLPGLNRPLSKHHEYNTAVILINIESWRQSGGGARYHYVPLLNYQHPGDKFKMNAPQIDTAGNVLYLSFGPGWYVIPYFFYQVFHWPASVIYLQVLNLFFHLAAVVMLFLLCEQLFPAGQTKRYETIVMVCSLFIFSPGILWYLGNGYVTTGIEMPFVFAALLMLAPMLRRPEEINGRRLLLLGLLIIILVYIDWFALFISVVAFVILFFRTIKERRYGWLLLTIALACVLAIALIVFQFASYIGMEKLLMQLKHQFLFRSIASKTPFLQLLGEVMQHMATSYLPVLILLAAGLGAMVWRKSALNFAADEKVFIGMYGVAVLLYNLVFIQWSAVHEFALIPLSLLLILPTARLMMTQVSTRGFYALLGCYITIAGLQYYIINRPGEFSWSGARYDSYQKLGEQLQSVPEDHKIFMNKDWSTVIDYYAHRNISEVKNIDSARAFMVEWGVRKAVWVEEREYRLIKIVELP